MALVEQALEQSRGIMEHSLAAGRLATLAMAVGDLAGARAAVEQCLAGATQTARYEGLLVAAELALSDGQPGARGDAANVVADLEAAGYRTSPALTRLKVRLGAFTPAGQAASDRYLPVAKGQPLRA